MAEVRGRATLPWCRLQAPPPSPEGQAATVGNGVMVALIVDSKEKVDAVYNKAIELGGKDEGAVGPRGDSGFYAGYFRDLDGNKLNVFCMSA